MRAAAAALIMAALRVNIGSFLQFHPSSYRRHSAPIATGLFALEQALVILHGTRNST
jgi:hypothetical protein